MQPMPGYLLVELLNPANIRVPRSVDIRIHHHAAKVVAVGDMDPESRVPAVDSTLIFARNIDTKDIFSNLAPEPGTQLLIGLADVVAADKFAPTQTARHVAAMLDEVLVADPNLGLCNDG